MDKVIIISDDINLEEGRLRIRRKGSSGGHNGLNSIINHIGSENFIRLKIGIGKPRSNGDQIKFYIYDDSRNVVLDMQSINELPLWQLNTMPNINELFSCSYNLPIDENGNLIKGKLGKELNTEDGYNAAIRCALGIVTQAKKSCNNDLSKIKTCIKLTGFVNSTEDYIEQPKVINGASDTIVKIFGESGMHTRAAVSTNSLPLGVAVEIDAIFELN